MECYNNFTFLKRKEEAVPQQRSDFLDRVPLGVVLAVAAFAAFAIGFAGAAIVAHFNL